MTTHQLLAAVADSGLICIARLRDAAGLPEKTLAKHYSWVNSGGKKGQPCPEKYGPQIRAALERLRGILEH